MLFRGGITSASFHVSGNVEMSSERLMVSVIEPRMTVRLSLMTRMLILSGSGDLFEGMDKMMRRTGPPCK